MDLTSASFDTYVYLEAPNGTIAAENDDWNGTDSHISFTLTSTGTWRVEATSFYQNVTGPYTLTVNACNAPLAAPGQLVVTYNHALFGSTPGVNVSWQTVTGAVDYEAEVNGQILDLQTSSGTDGIYGRAEPVCYVVRVRAVGSSGQRSGWSARNIATSVTFSDDPIIGHSTFVRAAHVNELRQAVNTVRAAAGLANYGFIDDLAPGITIRAIHFTQLRSALNEALGLLAISSLPGSDPTAHVTAIRGTDIQQLRDALK